MKILMAIVSIVLLAGCAASDADKRDIMLGDLDILCRAASSFRQHTGRHPTEQEGVDVLRVDPGVAGWQGPYIHVRAVDPWLNPYHMIEVTNGVRFISSGPDGVLGTTDDEHMTIEHHPAPYPEPLTVQER